MKLIESKAEYIPQEEGLEGIYKQIELAGRTAYHSLDKITPDSARNFVDRMIKSRHGAALEHGTVYLKVGDAYEDNKPKDIFSSGKAVSTEMYPWLNTPYCKINKIPSKEYSNVYDAYITTNLRYIWEKELGDLQGIHNEFLTHMCSPTEFHEKRYTMRFTCSRAISHELVRSRTMSFAQESQRYINYSKERHGGEITYIIPSWYSDKKTAVLENPKTVLEVNIFSQDSKSYQFEKQLSSAEAAYFRLLNEGCTPQQARDVLPNATKTELIMTGFSSDWRFLMDLRLFGKTGVPHPDMLDLMHKTQKAMQDAGIWEDIMSKPSKFE